uniref:NACHT LRR and PYD domain-containing protein n=1 Tax=Pseudonaja textilis TaxID=8673 RepID=A0A670ZDM3_PSETE
MSLRNLDDKAMEVLCEGLKHPECAIETLSGEILTESSSRHLAEVHRKNQRLNRLYLSLKNPDDKAMEVLCEGLKHPECAIKTGSSVALHNHIPFNCYKNTFLLVFHKIIVIFLAILHRLSGEILTESSSRHLAEVLRKNQRLNVLYLSFENPDDKAMEVLCEGLNHPECAIKTLIFTTPFCDGYYSINISRRGSSVALHNHIPFNCYKNTFLLVFHKIIVIFLAILHRLSGEILTKSCSRHLAEVLRKNQRLNVLYLSLKNPDDKAMEVLCEGLNHPECAIKTLQGSTVALHYHIRFNCYQNTFLLVFHKIVVIFVGIPHRLSGEILTESCSSVALHNHIPFNCYKNTFLLVFHEVVLLFLAILHRLSGEILTKSSSRHLAEVLRKKQRLNVLYLSLKNPDDKAMEVLCEGLKHPECAIKTLQ